MNHLHKREHLDSGDIVQVDCSHQCNIIVLDDTNYRAYKAGRGFKSCGGFYKKFPARIVVPSTGHWNVVLDLAGGAARIKHSITFIKAR